MYLFSPDDCGNLWTTHHAAKPSGDGPAGIGPSGALSDAGHELADLVVDLPAFLHQRLDLLHGVDHGRVVPSSELPGDRRIRQVGDLAEHVHRNLTGGDERTPPALALDLLDGEVEHLGRRVEDDLRRDRT